MLPSLITFLDMSELKKWKVKWKSFVWIKKKGTFSTPLLSLSFYLYLTVNCTLFQCWSIIKQSITKSFPHLSHHHFHFSSAKQLLYPSGPLHLLFSFRGMGQIPISIISLLYFFFISFFSNAIFFFFLLIYSLYIHQNEKKMFQEIDKRRQFITPNSACPVAYITRRIVPKASTSLLF